MKKLTVLFFLLITAIVYGQQVPPQGINFQAVLFDEYGTPVPSLNENSTLNNQSAEATFTFYNFSSGLYYYSETHSISTDEFGRFQVVLGRGTPLGSNTFQNIIWSDGNIFLDFEVALNGQSKRLVSSQELLSVPYALLAEKAMVAQTAVDVDDADADPTNEIQVLSASNDTIFLSSGGYVVLSPDQINDADADPSNEIQSLNVSGDSLTLSSGNTVQLPVINDADADPTNEIQTITRNGVSITLSGNGGSISVFDGDYNNLTNTPTIPTTTSDLTNNSGFLTIEVDGSTTNELQSLSVTGDSLTLSNGNTIELPVINDADADPNNEIQDLQDVLSESNDASNKAVFNIKRQSIGQLALDTSAVLDVASTTQGFLPPRMTEAQRDAIHLPAAGLILWCTDCGSNGELQVFNGTAYTNMAGGAESVSTPFTNITQLGADIDGEAAADYSGWSVSLSSDGSTLAIGAIGNDGNGSNSGHVRVFEYDNGTWTQLGADIDGEGASDQSGYSVSLSSDGSTVAIGAPSNDGNGSNSGHVRIYENVSGTWTQIGADIDGESANDASGYSVSLSSDGSTVAIGASGNDGNGSLSGHVRIYENVSGTWTQLGTDIDGEAAGDESGYSVSLSSDGSTVAIGAFRNDGNGPYSGHVRIYEKSTNSIFGDNWIQVAEFDGEAAYDYSGKSVSLSSDGITVAIGAPFNNGNGSYSGHVRIYEVR